MRRTEWRLADFTADRIDMATVAPDDSIVFTTINPVRMWRLKNGVVNLIAGGGDYQLNFGSPAKQVDLGLFLASSRAMRTQPHF